MKFLASTASALALASVFPDATLAKDNTSIRRRLISQQDPCRLVQVPKSPKYSSEGRTSASNYGVSWSCELSLKDAQSTGKKSVPIEGLTEEDLRNIEEGGETYLLAFGGTFENGRLVLPEGAAREFIKNPFDDDEPQSTPEVDERTFKVYAMMLLTAGGTCGNGDRGDGVCADGSCCSEYGWCGTDVEHCGGGGTSPPAGATQVAMA